MHTRQFGGRLMALNRTKLTKKTTKMEELPKQIYLYQMRRSALNTRQSGTNEEIRLPLRVIFGNGRHNRTHTQRARDKNKWKITRKINQKKQKRKWKEKRSEPVYCIQFSGILYKNVYFATGRFLVFLTFYTSLVAGTESTYIRNRSNKIYSYSMMKSTVSRSNGLFLVVVGRWKRFAYISAWYQRHESGRRHWTTNHQLVSYVCVRRIDTECQCQRNFYLKIYW